MKIKTTALFAIASAALAFAMPASAGTLDNIKSTGHIRLGYVPDAKPFTSMGASSPEGYGVQVCEAVVGQLKIQLGLSCNYSCSYCGQAAEINAATVTKTADVD